MVPYARAAVLMLLIASPLATISVPVRADDTIVTLECSGDVGGTFTIDFSGNTVATYDDNRTIDLSDVAITDSSVSFTAGNSGGTSDTSQTRGTVSQYQIDRKTYQIDANSFDYVDNKVTNRTHHVGQCKQVPTPHKPF